MDFRRILYWTLSLKPVKKLEIWLQADRNIGHCTRRPKRSFIIADDKESPQKLF
jgi:hypothetical protein